MCGGACGRVASWTLFSHLPSSVPAIHLPQQRLCLCLLANMPGHREPIYLGCDGTSSGFLAYLYTNLLLVFAAIAPTLLFMPLMMVRGRAAHSGAPEEVYNRRIRFNLQIWSRRAMREPQKQSPIRSDGKQSSVSSTAGADGSNHAEGEFDRAENPEPMDEELDQADAAHVAARKDGASSDFLRWRDSGLAAAH
jgi:hypothetical protein